MATDGKLNLTIICPVFNEQDIIPIFFERVKGVRDKLSDKYEVELLFTNNSSTDQTLPQILKIRDENPFVYVITISKNVGLQASLECGLRSAKGDLFVFIDVDCEDPPEMIADFVKIYEEGYDIVYGERADRDEPKLIMLGRKLFYRVLKAVADEEVILDMAEFSLITQEVRNAIVEDSSSFPFIRASIGRVGFKRKGIRYKRQKRIAGQTHFRLLGMAHFAIAGILSSSTLFLRLPIYSFFFWLLCVMAVAITRVYVDSRWIDVLLVLLFASYFGAAISFMAIYIGRTYKNSLGRPNFIISENGTFMQK